MYLKEGMRFFLKFCELKLLNEKTPILTIPGRVFLRMLA